MTDKYPPFAAFPDLNAVLRTPTGKTYRGALRRHDAAEPGEHWYEGYFRAVEKDDVTDDATLAARFKKEGRPGYFDPRSAAEPLRLKLNRIPPDKRSDRNAATLVGDFWTSEGLWTVVASPSQSAGLHLAGSIVPSRHEIEFAHSRIRHLAKNAAAEAPAPKPAPAAAPTRRRGPG